MTAGSTSGPGEDDEKGAPEAAVSAPRSFDEIIGQPQAVSRLQAIAQLARERATPAPHLLLIGPEGSGRRTFAGVLAGELRTTLVVTSGPAIERVGDLLGILSNLNERDVLFIDALHHLPRAAHETLRVAMADFAVDFVTERGLNARTIRHRLSAFTCIGAAPHDRDVPAILKSLFPITIALQPYSAEELGRIAVTWCERRGVGIDGAAAALVARLAVGSLQQLRTFLQLLESAHQMITAEYAADLLSRLGFTSALAKGGSAAPHLMSLSGIEFEQLIQNLLDQLGFQTQLTAVTGDGGVDIQAYLDRPIVGGRYLIQCKRFAEGTPVGAPTVREFYGAVAADHAAVKGILITTSDFTSQAREFAANVRIDLVDGQQLQGLLKTGSVLPEPQ